MDPVDRLELIDMLKKRMRRNNWNYLCRHKEVRAIIRVILQEVIKSRPDDIYNFVAGMFHCDNMELMTKQINDQRKRVSALMKNTAWTDYDGEMLFSNTSTGMKGSTVHSVLKFSLAEREAENEDANTDQSSESIEISVNKLIADV